MSLLDFDKQETWNLLYEERVAGRTLHFCRETMHRIYGNDMLLAIEALPEMKGKRVVVIGAAFGYGVEQMREAGIYAIATDTSRWIAKHKSANSRIEIFPYDVLTLEGREWLGRFDWALTEDVLPVLSDAEAIQMSSACRMIADNVVHWLTTGTNGGYSALNWKTLEEWKILVSPDTVVGRNLSGKRL